jgi:hypothetical protein
VVDEASPWPAFDAAWVWTEGGAFDAWDRRWGRPDLPPERQRQAVRDTFRSEWRAASGLRASVKGWLPRGPEVAMREATGTAWIWVGDRILLVRLSDVERVRKLRKLVKP